MAAFRQYVDPPRFTPTPYGLLTVVQFPPTPDHWQGGVIYQPNCTTGIGMATYDECIAVTGIGAAAPPTPAAFVNTVQVGGRIATPFTVMEEFDCSWVGNDDANAEKQVRDAMASSEGWQVERTFWTGLAGGQTVAFPHLAASANLVDASSAAPYSLLLQSAAVTVSGVGDTLKSPVETLGLLEGALADCYGGVGVIHIPQVAAPSFDAWGLLHPRNGVMYTANGNMVAIGGGYTGSKSDGTARAVDTSWIYATGQIIAYRDPDYNIRARDAQVIDRVKNNRKMIADRTYVLGWDCCHFAVNAALGTPKGT